MVNYYVRLFYDASTMTMTMTIKYKFNRQTHKLTVIYKYMHLDNGGFHKDLWQVTMGNLFRK